MGDDRPEGCIERAVYSDASLYDIAYFIGEAPIIAKNTIINDADFSDCCINQYPISVSGDFRNYIPDLPSSIWSSPPAVARQIRAFIEHHVDTLRAGIGSEKGGVEIRISLCRDGVVASIDWGEGFRYCYDQFNNLSRDDVLKILGRIHTDDSQIEDVFVIDPEAVSNIKGVIFVRKELKNNGLHNALVFNANDGPSRSRPYWRIPPAALKNPKTIIALIALR